MDGVTRGTVEGRKTVTVLFCDLVAFTELAGRLDPEALRYVMRRFFDRAAAVIEEHGGTVEKFIGDEVMAVFGVPVVRDRNGRSACSGRSAHFWPPLLTPSKPLAGPGIRASLLGTTRRSDGKLQVTTRVTRSTRTRSTRGPDRRRAKA